MPSDPKHTCIIAANVENEEKLVTITCVTLAKLPYVEAFNMILGGREISLGLTW